MAKRLSDVGVTDAHIIAAALLHDTVEDTETSWEELEEAFGKEITDYVREVSDDKTLCKDQRKRLQVEHALHASAGARLIKMADKLDNLSGLITDPPTWWTPNRIQGYFVWSRVVCDNCTDTSPASESPTQQTPSEQLRYSLDRLFRKTFELNGQTYDCIPKDVNLEEVLEEYYCAMAEAGKTEDD